MGLTMQRALIEQESATHQNFQYSFKPDFELYQGVYGNWVHIWHLWPRGMPSFTRWRQIACDAPAVDLFKLRAAIFCERQREGIEWDCHAHRWQFRSGAGSHAELMDKLEVWEMRTCQEWLALLSENRSVDIGVRAGPGKSVPVCGGASFHVDEVSVSLDDMEKEA